MSAGRLTPLLQRLVFRSALLPRPLRWRLLQQMSVVEGAVLINSGGRLMGSGLRVGEGSFINHDCLFDASRGRIVIGQECRIGPRCILLTSTHELGPSHRRAGRVLGADILVGPGSWLGAGCLVLPGVRIGEGCVIAAGAVVTSDCEAAGLYAGVPARRVKDLAPLLQH